MLAKYMKRVEPKDGSGPTSSSQAVVTTPAQSSNELGGGRHRRRSRTRVSSSMEKMLKLSAEQKCDIAQREIEELKEDIDKLRDDSDKVLSTFKVRVLLLNISLVICYIKCEWYSNMGTNLAIPNH